MGGVGKPEGGHKVKSLARIGGLKVKSVTKIVFQVHITVADQDLFIRWGPKNFHPQRRTQAPPLDPPLVPTERLDVLFAVTELQIQIQSVAI